MPSNKSNLKTILSHIQSPETRKKIAEIFADKYIASPKLEECLRVLDEANLLNTKNFLENFKQMAYAEQAHDLSLSLEMLQQKSWLNLEIFTLLVKQAKYAKRVSSGLLQLSRNDLFTETHCKLLLEYASYATAISAAMEILKKAKLFDENYNLIVQHASHAHHLSRGFESLQNAKLLNQNFLDLLFAHAEYADFLATGLATLKRENGSITIDNQALLCEHAGYASHLAQCLVRLTRAKFFDDKTNKEMLVNHIEYTGGLSHGLACLRDCDILIKKTVSYFKHAASAGKLGAAFLYLKKANLYDDYREKLLTNIEHINSIGTGLYLLSDAKLLDAENCSLLFERPKSAKILARGLQRLQSQRITLTEQDRELLRQAVRSPRVLAVEPVSKTVDDIISLSRNKSACASYLNHLENTKKGLRYLEPTNKIQIVKDLQKTTMLDEFNTLLDSKKEELMASRSTFFMKYFVKPLAVISAGILLPIVGGYLAGKHLFSQKSTEAHKYVEIWKGNRKKI